MASLFAKAALTARGRGGDLPDTRLARTGVEVDPGELAAYARVCGFGLGNTLPVTYPHVLAFPLQVALMSDRSFPLALPGLVHVRNRIEQTRWLKAGTPVISSVMSERSLTSPRSRAAMPSIATVTLLI